MDTDYVRTVSSNVVRVDVTTEGEEGNGTGLLVDNKGIIFTCEHVVRPEGQDADSIRVVRGNQEYVPEIVKLDSERDLALLRVPDLKGEANFVEYENVNIGEECFILGYPLRLSHLSLSKGTISAKGKRLGTQFSFELFQVDARINFGNSGGPVYQASTGKVIGIVTAKYLPFLTEVDELRKFVRELPQAPTTTVAISGISFGPFFNYVNDSVKRISDSLIKIQVGIGWLIPIHMFRHVTK